MVNKDVSNKAIKAIELWVKEIVVDHRFCPFAKLPFEQQRIAYRVANIASRMDIDSSLVLALSELDECIGELQNQQAIDTTLLIFPDSFFDFEQFLILLDYSEEFLEASNLTEEFQLAHFHPDYCFAGVDSDAAENFTNRAPFPVLHLLRQSSVSAGLDSISSPESIPDRNIRYANAKGSEFWQQALSKINEKVNEEGGL